MRFLGNIEKKRQYLFHGGSPVLLLTVQAPTGGTPAALHLTRLTELLTDYTKTHLFPLAVAAFTEAARQGLGYRFTPHRVCVSVTEQGEDSLCATLTFSVTVSDAPPITKMLVTRWDPSGTLQLPPSRHRPHRRRSRAHLSD